MGRDATAGAAHRRRQGHAVALLFAIIIGTVVTSLGGTALARQGSCQGSVSPASAERGAQVTVSGTGFASRVTISLGATVVAHAEPGHDSSFSIGVTIPHGIDPGLTAFRLVSLGCSTSVPFTVTSPPPTITTTSTTATTVPTQQPPQNFPCANAKLELALVLDDSNDGKGTFSFTVTGFPPNSEIGFGTPDVTEIGPHDPPYIVDSNGHFAYETTAYDYLGGVWSSKMASDPSPTGERTWVVTTFYVTPRCTASDIVDHRPLCENPTLDAYIATESEPVFENFLVIRVAGFPADADGYYRTTYGIQLEGGTSLQDFGAETWHVVDADGGGEFAPIMGSAFIDMLGGPTSHGPGLAPGIHRIDAWAPTFDCQATAYFHTHTPPPQSTQGAPGPPETPLTIAPEAIANLDTSPPSPGAGSPLGWVLGMVGVGLAAGVGGFLLGKGILGGGSPRE